MPEAEVLHKRIAASGLCSRRAAEQLILAGRVSVDGRVVRTLGTRVTPDAEVRVDGRRIRSQPLVTVVMNKPTKVMTTMSDPRGRRTVADLLPRLPAVVKPVGRLDWDTAGLLILTNDGELAARLTHPRYHVEKEYEATVLGHPTESDLQRLRRGVPLDGRRTLAAQAMLIGPGKAAGTSKLRIVVTEGRRRQVRRMCEAVGHPVVGLRRVRIGPLRLRKLSPGQCRVLSVAEVDSLRKAVGLEPRPRAARADRQSSERGRTGRKP